MGWYSQIKEADARSISNNALQLLNNGLNETVVLSIFTNQMRVENPTFNPVEVGGAANLRNYLERSTGAPQTPDNDLGQIPGQQGSDLGQIPGHQESDLGQIPERKEPEIGNVPGMEEENITDVEFEPLQEDTNPLQEDDIPGGDFDTLQEDKAPGSGEPETPIQQAIEEQNAAQDIEEIEDEVPELERSDEFEDMTLDIRPEDMQGGIEEVKRIPQRKFSVPTKYRFKDDNLKKVLNRIKKINQYKDSKGESPMTVRFVTQDGQVSSEPARYQKERKNPQGEIFYAEYVDLILEGEEPNPMGNPVKKIKNPDGTVSFDEVVYQIIGSIQIVPIDGFKPEEEKFKTKEEAIQFANQKNLEDPRKKWEVGSKNRSQSFGEQNPDTQGFFFPSTYNGRWRTIVDHYPNSPPWKQQYKEGSPLNCDHCNTKKRGKSARRSVYVAIEYPASQLITENGKPRRPLPEEIVGGKQVWIGTRCVEGQKSALQFLTDLEKLKEVAAGTESTGRASDAFGGSQRSPKGLESILANYFTAGAAGPLKSGNWWRKRYGDTLSEDSFKKFRRYYFGSYRTDRYKAAKELWEHERAVEDYPEKLEEYERNEELYPHFLREWERAGRNPEDKPVKPKVPKKPSDKAPSGPKPLPWGDPSEEDSQKAKDIISWWKGKEKDPTIDFNNLEIDDRYGQSGERMHNLTSLAMSGMVDSGLFGYLPDLVDGFNKNKTWPERQEETRRQEEEESARKGRRLVRDEESAYFDNDSWNARIERKRVEEIEKAEREQRQQADTAERNEQLRNNGITLSDMTQVPTDGEFTAEFKNIGTKESRTGRYSDFKGPDGITYRVFDKHKAQRREPKYDFQPGESYILNGRKGEYSEKWRNAPINGVTVVDPNAPAAPEAPRAIPEAPEGVVARPGTIPEGNIVPEETINRVPVEEPMGREPVEEPMRREPVENTILGDEERAEKIKTIKEISDYAKYVAENGKEPDSKKRGRIIPGDSMTPEELIPIFVSEIASEWHDFDREHFTNRLNKSYEDNGVQGLISAINLIPTFARNMI